MYSIMLTKAALLHRDYLPLYDAIVPASFLKSIDENRNCEDLAMAYVVATVVSKIWVKPKAFETHLFFYNIGESSTSMGEDHIL